MKRSLIVSILLILLVRQLAGQTESVIVLESDSFNIEGTLLIPDTDSVVPVVLIIAGSGPTDRDGNNLQMRNFSLKMIADGLLEKNIASLRYDKRGIGKSNEPNLREIDLRFDHYVKDVEGWLKLLNEDQRFNGVFIAGHSEGSLLGMIAAQKSDASGFISLAGAGDAAAPILRRQLAAQPPKILEDSEPVIKKLEMGELVDSVPKSVATLFRKSVQPYLISWFKYDPQVEIAKLNIPVLIIQGTTDIQITKDDSDKLFAAKPDAEYLIIEGMNHVLKDAPPERLKQLGTYYKPDIPLKEGLIEVMVGFINRVTGDR